MGDKMFDKYLKFIIDKHSGQLDKGGSPYFIHPIAVALKCSSESAKVVALFHDILEDTDATINDLYLLGLEKEEIDAIQLLTKPEKEDYMHYIKRIAKNPIAKEVKKCDLLHNMDLSRLETITERDVARKEKYQKAYNALSNSILYDGED